jgi:hypothetical protein
MTRFTLPLAAAALMAASALQAETPPAQPPAPQNPGAINSKPPVGASRSATDTSTSSRAISPCEVVTEQRAATSKEPQKEVKDPCPPGEEAQKKQAKLPAPPKDTPKTR